MRNAVILFFIFFSLHGVAKTQCGDLLERKAKVALLEGTPFDKEWIDLFSREAGAVRDREYFLRYVTRATDSIFHLFEPWLDGKITLNYSQLMAEMHSTIVFGPGNFEKVQEIVEDVTLGYEQKVERLNTIFETYNGYYEGIKGTPDASSNSNSFRGGQNSYFTRPTNTDGPTYLELNFSLEERKKVAKWLGKNVSDIEWAISRFEQLEIPELLEKNDWPMNLEKNYSFDHVFPSYKVLEKYADLSGIELSFIKDNLLALSQDDFLNHLAKYYYTAINAHFFDRANNSILMAQVNFLLIKKEIHGVPHGYFDILAFTTQFPTFKNEFKAVILR